jgi:23S rRNA (cytosine1962-C5)-methyltransferase
MLESGQVWVRKRGADRIRRGHLWIYQSDVLRTENATPGAIVTVHEEKPPSGARDAIVGKAFYSSKSQIALRFLARGEVRIDEGFIRNRFSDATALRAKLGVDPHFSRRIYSEGDFLPGLIVDRYDDRLVVQSLTQGTDRLQPLVLSLLQDQYQPRSILLRNDSKVRQLEGLELKQDLVGDPLPQIILVKEDDQEIAINLTEGQKTGAFLDQRDNRRAAKRYASGRALDGFTYAGGFALHLSSVCSEIEAVDLSAGALKLAKSNVERNRSRNIRCIEANVFDYLREKHGEGVRYDTIVLDPPAFAKSRDQVPAALRGYKEINNRAMRLLKDGGILITCSCSHHLSESVFAEMLAEAGNEAGRWIRVLERRIQSPDHPVLMTVPETLYLKCFILEIRG